MRLTMEQSGERLRGARLATAGADGQQHLVPLAFAAEGDHVYVAIDHKPETPAALRRLENISENPRVNVLVDDLGVAVSADPPELVPGVVVETGPDRKHALDLLATKYPQYTETRPAGPVVAITVDRISGWAYRG